LQTLALGSGLAGRDCEVMLAAARSSPLAEAAAGRLPLETFRFESIPLVTPPALARLCREWNPDVIHAQTSRAHTHAWLARTYIRNAAPLVVSRRVAFHLTGGPLGRLKYRRGVAHYIPISRAAAATLTAAGVPDDQMTVIPSGVDTVRFGQAAGNPGLLDTRGISRDNFIVGTAGSFTPEKGHGVLIDAAKLVIDRHPECYFILVGTGWLEEELQARAEGEGRGRIGLILATPPLEEVLPQFDLFVLPSLKEGLSTALLAAMAAGIPVVASRTGGIPEVVTEGCGLLVPPGDAESLADAIASMIDNEAMRQEIAQRAQARVHDFDIALTVERTLQVYRRIIEGGGERR
jgi:glycosyltransferase involved in cell wall biosynthesis